MKVDEEKTGNIGKIGTTGFKQFRVDPLQISEVVLPPNLIIAMISWNNTCRSVFESLYLLTDGGQYGILITGPQLCEFANISLPSVFTASSWLINKGWINKEKHLGAGQPNIFFINLEKLQNISGDILIIATESRDK